MSAAARVGDQGTPFVTTPIIITGSPDVFIDGRPVARLGDVTATFQKKSGKKIITLTSVILSPSGEPTVFVNNRPVAQLQTAMTNGAKVISSSATVFIG